MSIFAEQLRFEPLTERRKLFLKMDVYAIVFCICVLYLICRYLMQKTEIDTCISAFFINLFHPAIVWLQTQFGPPLQELLQWCLPEQIRTAMLSGLKAFANAMYAVWKFLRVFLSAASNPIILLVCYSGAIAYHSGLIGPARTKSQATCVLSHELHKIRVRLLEPRINLRFDSSTTMNLAITAVVLMLVSFLSLLIWWSGLLSATGWQFAGLSEPGVNNWLLACLGDAHIAYPPEWREYSKAWFIDNNRDILALLFTIKEAPIMPPDLFRFRLFIASLCGVVGALPIALTCLSIGIDSFSARSLTLTPTRLIVRFRTLYFLYFSKIYRWENLLSASLENRKGGDQLVLKFSNTKKEVTVNFDKLGSKQQSTLIQGLEELAPSCQFSTEVRALFDKSRKDSSGGYTLFWDDELAKQRRSTVFVPLEQGARLKGGDLEVLRQLSGQGWSCTYLARYNGEFVVLRESVLSDDTNSGKRALETLEKEAKILSSLNHTSIAKVLDFFVENQRSYLMLEYVVGQDLRKRVASSGFVNEHRVIEIGIEVCNILQYLHDRDPQVLHRDISPDNLVITANGQLRLIDFAAAKQFIENATGTMIGKRSYMAPEQLRGKASPKSDIYSLGATLYFLLTGKDPIALNECRILEQRPELSPELDRLIREMTSFDDINRPESVVSVREKLQYILRDRRSAGGALLESMRAGLLGHDEFKIKLNSQMIGQEQCK